MTWGGGVLVQIGADTNRIADCSQLLYGVTALVAAFSFRSCRKFPR